MVDLVKFSVPLIYSRNKNLQYKQNIVEMSTSLLAFLKAEGLIITEPFNATGELKMDFQVRESELTDEGLKIFKDAIPKWWKKIDKGMGRSDIEYLKSEQKKIRSAS